MNYIIRNNLMLIDEYIDDGSLVTDNLMFTTLTEYPIGFNDSVEYVLIVAG